MENTNLLSAVNRLVGPDLTNPGRFAIYDLDCATEGIQDNALGLRSRALDGTFGGFIGNEFGAS
jgi:hypothetical protein